MFETSKLQIVREANNRTFDVKYICKACAVEVLVKHSFCWNCGARFTEVIRNA